MHFYFVRNNRGYEYFLKVLILEARSVSTIAAANVKGWPVTVGTVASLAADYCTIMSIVDIISSVPSALFLQVLKNRT